MSNIWTLWILNSDLIFLIYKTASFHGILIYFIRKKHSFLDQIGLIVLVKGRETGLFTVRSLRTFNGLIVGNLPEWVISTVFQVLTLKYKVNMHHASVNCGTSPQLFKNFFFFFRIGVLWNKCLSFSVQLCSKRVCFLEDKVQRQTTTDFHLNFDGTNWVKVCTQKPTTITKKSA